TAQGATPDQHATLYLTQGTLGHVKTTEIKVIVNGKEIKFGKATRMFEIGSVVPEKRVNVIYATVEKKKIAVLIQARPDSRNAACASTQAVDAPVPKPTAARIMNKIGAVVIVRKEGEQTVLHNANAKAKLAGGKLTKASIECPLDAEVMVETSPNASAQRF